MHHTTLLLCLIATLACSKPPTVDFGPDKQSKLTELDAATITKAWYEGVRAFEQVVDLDGYCMMRGVFRKYSREGDTNACQALYKGCLHGGQVDLPKETYEDWQIALSESCEATVGQLETCTNDALKQLDKALSSISCNTPPQMLDHKLQVPESCRLLEQSCIIPTLSYYIRNAGRE
jgi:hypothetical protein